jgi:hypothetical protein
MSDPRYILFYLPARSYGEYRRQIKDLKRSSITYSRMRMAKWNDRLFSKDPESVIFQEVMNGFHQGSL